MSSSDDFLKILQSWKDSEGVIVARPLDIRNGRCRF
jgi:hypothetical protein